MSIFKNVWNQMGKVSAVKRNLLKKNGLSKRSLRLEHLEERQLLAVDLAVNGTAGALEAQETLGGDGIVSIPLTETTAENAEPLEMALSTETPSIGTLLTIESPYTYKEVKYQWFRVSSDGTETKVEKQESYRYKVTTEDAGYLLKAVITGRSGLEGRTGEAVTNAAVSLATPEFTLIKVRYGEMTAVWHTVQAADLYSVTYSTDPNFTESETVQTSNNNITVAAQALGSTYYFRIQALDSTGKFLASAVSETSSAVQNCLETPALRSIKPSGPSVLLEWNGVADVEFYEINYSQDDFETFETKIVDAKTTSIIISNLTMGETYSIRLRARNTLKGNDFNSLWTKRNITLNRLETPMLQMINLETADISIAWKSSLYADRFVVYYADNADFANRKVIVVGQVYSLQIDGLNSGITYYFTVQARDTAGQYKNSAFAGSCSFAYEDRYISQASLIDDLFNEEGNLEDEEELLSEIL